MRILKGYCGMLTEFPDIEVDVEGHVDEHGFRYFGKATLQASGMWKCLADIGGMLCIVEVKLTFPQGRCP